MTKELDLTFTKVMTDWYAENKRDLPWRIDKNPYHVWVSEIMLQQTRVCLLYTSPSPRDS